MEDKITLAELEGHLTDVETRFKDLAAQFADRDFTAEAEIEWEALKGEVTETKDKIAKRKQRMQELEALSRDENHVEDEEKFSFRIKRAASGVPDDPTDLAEYRVRARSLDELEQGYKDGARKIIEQRYRHSHPAVSREEAQDNLDKLVGVDQEVAIRTIATSSPKYKKEFELYVQGLGVGPEMTRAASLTTTAGGFAVPVELDTTLLLTNAGVVNPVRNLARVRQTNVNTVEFINTTGIVAAFGAEATEASDNAPTLAQPTVNIEKAFAFVPMSIEIAEDWANIQADVAMAFADAKNQLESTKFLTGLGHTSHEPQGLIAAGGSTAIITSAATATFALGDVYALSGALSPRYRNNATLVANRAAFDKARQFNTAGTYGAWVDLAEGRPATLTGYPVAEWSAYSAAVTTSAATIATLGDFNYFAIVDRVGMNVEFIPHLFGNSNRFPTGQRGLYMYWRTSSQVLSPLNQVNSAFVSLKLL
jgi:HK97 family phage major capsid protein